MIENCLAYRSLSNDETFSTGFNEPDRLMGVLLSKNQEKTSGLVCLIQVHCTTQKLLSAEPSMKTTGVGQISGNITLKKSLEIP